jgi:hypothetical protein
MEGTPGMDEDDEHCKHFHRSMSGLQYRHDPLMRTSLGAEL